MEPFDIRTTALRMREPSIVNRPGVVLHCRDNYSSLCA
jgi:hypothetical protein